MLEQAIGVDVALPDLALGSVVADEPVVAERLRVLLPRLPHHFGGLLPEAVELAFADLQSGSHLKHVFSSLLTTRSSRMRRPAACWTTRASAPSGRTRRASACARNRRWAGTSTDSLRRSR